MWREIDSGGDGGLVNLVSESAGVDGDGDEEVNGLDGEAESGEAGGEPGGEAMDAGGDGFEAFGAVVDGVHPGRRPLTASRTCRAVQMLEVAFSRGGYAARGSGGGEAVGLGSA